MAKVLKWLLIVVVGLVVLVAAAVAAVITLVDPNDYRDDIAAVVERHTGRPLTIAGDLSLSFFPRLGVAAEEVSLADAPGFGEEPFVSVSRMTLGVAVRPLLSGELALDTITLEAPRIRLVRGADGRANWEQFPVAGTRRPGSPVRPATLVPAQDGDSGSPLPPIVREARLDGVEIRDAHVSYRDEAAGTALDVQPLALSLTDVRFGAPVPVEAQWQARVADGPAVDGSLSGRLSIDAALRTARAEGMELTVTASGAGIPADEQRLDAAFEAVAELTDGVYRVPELTVEAAGARVLGEAEARTSAEGLVVAASLELPRVSPREVLAELAIEPPETRDPEVLQRLEGSAELRLREGVLRVEPLSLTVDDTELTGQASVSDFATPAFAFELGADALDLDRYLPPEAEEDAAGTPGGAAAAGAAELPVETLRALNLDGRITVAELKAYGVRAREVELVVRAADGELRVHPLNASLYGGQYQGDVRVDATGDEARIRVDERLEGISAGPLLTDLMGFEKLLGTASLSLQASTTGRTTDALLETLSGEARFEFLDGAVKGINIARMLREGVARLRGGSLEAAAEARRTDFSSLTGTIDLDGGIARNLDFEAKTPLLRITGEGTVNLIEQMVDYALTVNVVDTLSGQGGEELQALRRVAVPLRFTGSLTDPDISLAVGEALRGVAEERVREEVEEKQQEAREKVEEKVGEKLDEEVGDRLRNLLGE